MAMYNDWKLINEGKSKKIYRDSEWIYLEFKGDVRCSAYPEAFDERIAMIRAKTSYDIFHMLAKRLDGIAKVEQVSPVILRMEPATPLPLEWIPRFVAAGSVVKRFGFADGQRFKNTVLKIDYKTDEDDYLINDDLIVEKEILTADQLKIARQLAIDIGENLQKYSAERGLDLWDFKLELGINLRNKLCLIDEISFDGMRLKDCVTQESLDKDVYRRTGNVELVVQAYEKAYSRLFDGTF